MPFTPGMRQSVDQIRDYLFGGGYPDPVNNAEQLAFLFFFYLIEGLDSENEARAKVLKKKYESIFAGSWALKNPLNAIKKGETTIPRERFRWSIWAKGLSGEPLVRFVRDEVFAFFTEFAGNGAVNFMNGARLSIDEPTVLTQVVTLVDGLRLDRADADTKGDLFEHVLKQIKHAGELGQFRTPRHIIRAIVAMIDPKIGETVCDPAAGTAGFLVAAYDRIRLANSSPRGIVEVEADGKTQRRGLGDKLSAAQVSALQTKTFFGNDVDPKFVRLATMNLTLRGLPNVHIIQRNVLTTTLDNERKAELGLPHEGYHVILANPPFSGRLDKDRIVDDVKVGTTTATEILFLKYMMDSLRPNGRCGVIVPEGVLFGSTGAHKELRRQLIENNRVEAVLSLPGGVFQPYSGVKTSTLVFRKGGKTENVLFLHADNDGYKLDANHDTPISDDDLPALVEAFQDRDARLKKWEQRDAKAEWAEQWWFADADTLRANDFNLSAGRYRPLSQTQAEHQDPRELLDELAAIEAEIVEEVEALRAVFRGRSMTSPLVRLGDYCKQDRMTIPSGERADLRYIGLESIEGATGQFLEGELSKTPSEPKANSFLFGPSHVLYGKLRPYLNKVALPGFEGKCSTELIPLLPDERLDRTYLAFFLRCPSTVARIAERTAGSRMPRADMDFVLDLALPLPALAEQRRRVDLLSRAEGIVRLRREAEKKAQAIVPALFLDIFGDPATNPKRWAVGRLGDLLTRPSGMVFHHRRRAATVVAC